MPTPATAKWPRPKSEDEWEDMVLDAMRIRWSDPNASRNGRRGQEQDGVDIFGSSPTGVVGAQAKNIEQLAESDAVREIVKAENFSPKLKEYFFSIAGPRDAKFQSFIRNLSVTRSADNLFSVHVLFFEDVVCELLSSESLILKYWGHFFSDFANAIGRAAEAPLLDEGAALDQIRKLNQFKLMTEYFNAISDPGMSLSLVVEHAPDLRAPLGHIERFWRIAIGESRPENIVFTQRIGISIDGKDVRIWEFVENCWLTIEEWNQFQLSLAS